MPSCKPRLSANLGVFFFDKPSLFHGAAKHLYLRSAHDSAINHFLDRDDLAVRLVALVVLGASAIEHGRVFPPFGFGAGAGSCMGVARVRFVGRASSFGSSTSTFLFVPRVTRFSGSCGARGSVVRTVFLVTLTSSSASTFPVRLVFVAFDDFLSGRPASGCTVRVRLVWGTGIKGSSSTLGFRD